MSILVITTGGTIGALPYPDSSKPPVVTSMPEDGTDLVAEALKRPEFKFPETRCVSFEPKDSKHIDDEYRKEIANAIVASGVSEAIITHGTDRLLHTADYFYQQRKTSRELENKIIILTGAMVALANGPSSDGYLNLEFSLRQAASGKLQSGVYVVLCDYEDPDNARGAWKPRLYSHQPGVYEKVYGEDGRYNRLRPIGKT
jgi:L-asparaginase/Glu-tRNA(Gln) amidotransferase subunit D